MIEDPKARSILLPANPRGLEPPDGDDLVGGFTRILRKASQGLTVPSYWPVILFQAYRGGRWARGVWRSEAIFLVALTRI